MKRVCTRAGIICGLQMGWIKLSVTLFKQLKGSSNTHVQSSLFFGFLLCQGRDWFCQPITAPNKSKPIQLGIPFNISIGILAFLLLETTLLTSRTAELVKCVVAICWRQILLMMDSEWTVGRSSHLILILTVWPHKGLDLPTIHLEHH